MGRVDGGGSEVVGSWITWQFEFIQQIDWNLLIWVDYFLNFYKKRTL